MQRQETVPATQEAFAALAERHRRELQVHCYRMLGSFEDSEDLVQETFLRAWRKRDTFEGRSSFRAWLYRIATNACLDALERRPRVAPTLDGRPPEIPWLQAYPDSLLADGPEDEVVERETIELAFIAAIQCLPPRQRAVLIARDVLGWSAAESADLLEMSVAAANSALQRARETLGARLPRRREEWEPGREASRAEQELVARFIEATERGDRASMVALLREDALFSMPPEAVWDRGAQAIVDGWAQGGFGDPAWGDLRCIEVRVNRQPGVACYHRPAGAESFHPLAIDVLEIEDRRVVEIVGLPLEPYLSALGLPRTL